EPGPFLDLASGTGDLAAALARRAPRTRILRLDLSAALLRQAEPKLAGRLDPSLVAEMERLPLRAGACGAITMGFALRHVESLERLMESCLRALRPGGRIVFVDMSLPETGIWGRIFRFYFRACLPRIAALCGGEREAYELMVRSVEGFPGWEAAADAARRAGCTEVRILRLTGGAARILSGRKPPRD
ncbi:MAG: methyltransferase domain-containing protein, partial [Candidatus Eisenbacteria bacterium]|nr:methyltransferase domain-containing protein [Candidatus Latescibacterota bacterium]MBD3303190.1 methyltransferase domain-containing protein [Candidatus Eisenbacteria bacterium]